MDEPQYSCESSEIINKIDMGEIIDPAMTRFLRFFIAEPGDLIPPHHSQEWQEWEVGDHQWQDRICLTSSRQKAELVRDALESHVANRSTIIPDDEEIQAILDRAYQAYRIYKRGIRGQLLTAMDNIEYWAVIETLKWASTIKRL